MRTNLPQAVRPLLSAHYPLSYAGTLITPGLLSHISTIRDKASDSVKEPDPEATSVLCIGIGLPPVSKKLVACIQAGEYIDMAELLPDCLGISTGLANRDDKQATRPRRRQVTNILEWIQCFGIYVAVLTLKYPDRIQDLLGYKVEACMEYNCEAWLGYDCRFRQDAAASSNTVWALFAEPNAAVALSGLTLLNEPILFPYSH